MEFPTNVFFISKNSYILPSSKASFHLNFECVRHASLGASKAHLYIYVCVCNIFNYMINI